MHALRSRHSSSRMCENPRSVSEIPAVSRSRCSTYRSSPHSCCVICLQSSSARVGCVRRATKNDRILQMSAYAIFDVDIRDMTKYQEFMAGVKPALERAGANI